MRLQQGCSCISRPRYLLAPTAVYCLIIDGREFPVDPPRQRPQQPQRPSRLLPTHVCSSMPGTLREFEPISTGMSLLAIFVGNVLSSPTGAGLMGGVNVSSSFLPLERHEFPLPATIAGADVPLKCTALRYPVSQSGLTLIFTHGVSGRTSEGVIPYSTFNLSPRHPDKEQYHTTITRLLSLRDKATYDIREIWSIDFPNHGEAATLNRRLLDEHKANGVRRGFDGSCSESRPSTPK